MVIKQASVRVDDVLARWARREWDLGKLRGQALPTNEPEWLELLGRHVGDLVAMIHASGPIDASRVGFEPSDLERLRLYSGEPVGTRCNDELVARLVATPDPTRIVCTALVDMTGPFFIYDGWNRSAAWRKRIELGHRDLLDADVIKVSNAVLTWPRSRPL